MAADLCLVSLLTHAEHDPAGDGQDETHTAATHEHGPGELALSDTSGVPVERAIPDDEHLSGVVCYRSSLCLCPPLRSFMSQTYNYTCVCIVVFFFVCVCVNQPVIMT